MSGSIEEIRPVFEQLERHMFDVVNGVQDGKEIRRSAFERTEQLSKQLTALLKGEDLLPRNILLQLSQAANILRNEASYMSTTAEKQEGASDGKRNTGDVGFDPERGMSR